VAQCKLQRRREPGFRADDKRITSVDHRIRHSSEEQHSVSGFHAKNNVRWLANHGIGKAFSDRLRLAVGAHFADLAERCCR